MTDGFAAWWGKQSPDGKWVYKGCLHQQQQQQQKTIACCAVEAVIACAYVSAQIPLTFQCEPQTASS